MKNQFKKGNLFLVDGLAIELLENVTDGKFVRVCFLQTSVLTWINATNREQWEPITKTQAATMPTMDVQHDA